MSKEIKHTIRLDEAHEAMLRNICGFEGMNVTDTLTMLIEHWAEGIIELNTEHTGVLTSADTILASVHGLVDVILPGEAQ